MASKVLRRQRIRELLSERQLFSQEQLQEILEAEGLEVTQATLSRDLRDLAVSKGPSGYQLPPANSPPGVSSHREGSDTGHASLMTRELERMLGSQLLGAQAAGNLAVLRTMPGHASPLAIEIDRSQLPGVMGTIAGDDTVFVAARSAGQIKRLVRTFRSKAGQN